MSLQSITFPDAAYDTQLRGANWIQTYIYPDRQPRALALAAYRDASRTL